MDLLREIITLDKAACARVEAAVQRQKQRTDEFGENTAKEREKKLSEERASISAFKADREKALSERKRNAEESLKKRVDALDSTFKENGERWKAEILERITQITEE